MLKSFADLKRDMKIGVSLTLLESPTMPQNSKIGVKRYIVKVQGNGFYLSPNKTDTNGSFFGFEKASLTEYDGEEVRIYQTGNRPLTEQEMTLLNGRPSLRPEYKKLVEQDIQSDSSTTWHMDLQYFEDRNAEYLWRNGGPKYRAQINGEHVIIDSSIKGQLFLRYKVEK